MSETVDKVFDHLIPKTGSAAIFVDNNLGNVTKKGVVKHIFSYGQELTDRNATGASPSQSKNAIRMRELRKDPEYCGREKNRRRLRRIQKKEKKKIADNVDEEQSVLRRILKQYILSDYVYEVEERLVKTQSATLFASRILLKLLLTSTFAFRKWARRTYRGLYCIGILTVKLDNLGNLIEILIKIKLCPISTLFVD